MADISTPSCAHGARLVSDRPAFGAKDDIRFERKPPDRNILDRDRIVDGLKQWGVVLVFVAVVVIFAVLLPATFLTTRNAVNILNNSPTLVLFATAATLSLILGEFDLSFPAVADLVAVTVCPNRAALTTRGRDGETNLVRALGECVIKGRDCGVMPHSGVQHAAFGHLQTGRCA